MIYEEKLITTEQIHKGNIISMECQTVELPDGRKATRDIVRHPGASVIVPLTEEVQLYMVRQFRKPIDSISLEIPAGKLDEGEDPLVCAERELKEETGLKAESLRHIISIHSTPGFSNEILHMYLATGLSEGEACSDEDEFITCEKIPVETLVKMVLAGEITDAKSIIGILLAERMVKNKGLQC